MTLQILRWLCGGFKFYYSIFPKVCPVDLDQFVLLETEKVAVENEFMAQSRKLQDHNKSSIKYLENQKWLKLVT